MRLTEMYEYNARQNERAHSAFFIITHNDYELNSGRKKKKKCHVNLYLRAVVPVVVMKV